MALSVVHRRLSVVDPLSDVSCVTCGICSNEVMKAIFQANVSHMPGLCLLDIGGALCIGYKITPP